VLGRRRDRQEHSRRRRDGYPPSARRLSELLLSTQVVENGGVDCAKLTGRIQADACMAAASAAASAGDSRLDLAKSGRALQSRFSSLVSVNPSTIVWCRSRCALGATSPQVIQLGSRERQRRGAAVCWVTVPRTLIGILAGFGAGALLSAVSFDLIAEAEHLDK